MRTVTRKPGTGTIEFAPQQRQEVIERIVEVVTFVHGGGAISSEGDHPQSPTRNVDPVTPLRGSALRGQLRFWWRATFGCLCSDIAELRAQEDALWGNASSPGLVNLSIDQSFSRESVSVEKLGGVGTGLRYGAFASANVTRLKGQAKIRIAIGKPKNNGLVQPFVQQVENALTAWLLFGGIGGRTRRGFGAVHADGLPDPREFVAGLSSKATAAKVPALHGAHVVLSAEAFTTAEDAHRFAVDTLRKFRQGVDIGRNEGQQRNRPGRSRWPEADEIRRIQRKYPPEHKPEHPVRAFPRGVFGMPIVFHFMGKGEPTDMQILPGENIGRMASPIILRPARIDGRWYAMATRLVIPHIDLRSAVLSEGRRGSLKTVPVAIDTAQAQAIRPLAAQGGNPDVLAAFLAFFATLHP